MTTMLVAALAALTGWTSARAAGPRARPPRLAAPGVGAGLAAGAAAAGPALSARVATGFGPPSAAAPQARLSAPADASAGAGGWTAPPWARSLFDGAAADPFAVAQALAPVVVSVLTPDLRAGVWRKIEEPGPAGHCYAASEALYHLAGGKKAGWTPMVGRGVAMRGLPAGTHWFLRHDPTGRVLDATAAQFPRPYRYDRGRGTGFLTKKPSKRAAEIIRRVRGVLAERASAARLRPELTAMTRRGPSTPVRLAASLIGGDVLDYGAGRGADARYLRGKGLRVAAYDPYYFPEKPRAGRRFDWVLLNYVLNVIAAPAERRRALQDVAGRLKPGGRALIAVRGRAQLRAASAAWKRHGDGWITPRPPSSTVIRRGSCGRG